MWYQLWSLHLAYWFDPRFWGVLLCHPRTWQIWESPIRTLCSSCIYATTIFWFYGCSNAKMEWGIWTLSKIKNFISFSCCLSTLVQVLWIGARLSWVCNFSPLQLSMFSTGCDMQWEPRVVVTIDCLLKVAFFQMAHIFEFIVISVTCYPRDVKYLNITERIVWRRNNRAGWVQEDEMRSFPTWYRQ